MAAKEATMNASARHTKNFPFGIFSLDTSLNNLENPDREIYSVQKQGNIGGLVRRLHLRAASK